MQLNKDISCALQLLDEIEEHTLKSDLLENEPSSQTDQPSSQSDLHLLRSVLENPIIRNIATIQDSLEALRKEFDQNPSMKADDFDITPTGDLTLTDSNVEPIYKEVSDDEEIEDVRKNCDKKQVPVKRTRSIQDITFTFFKDTLLTGEYNHPRRCISLLEGSPDTQLQDISDLSRIISNTNRLKSRSLNVVPINPDENTCRVNHGKTEHDLPYLPHNFSIFKETINVGKWGSKKDEPKKKKEKSHSLATVIDFDLWDNEIQLIVLRKGDKGLGFSIYEHRDNTDPTKTAIVIKNLVPNGMAKIDGRLMPGDRIMLVNDIKFENISLEAAAKILKGISNGLVRIGVVKHLSKPVDDH